MTTSYYQIECVCGVTVRTVTKTGICQICNREYVIEPDALYPPPTKEKTITETYEKMK